MMLAGSMTHQSEMPIRLHQHRQISGGDSLGLEADFVRLDTSVHMSGAP